LTAPLAADQFSRSGTSGAQFLEIGVGARYNGLAAASVASANDVYSMYWNPAGLTYVAKNEIGFTYVNYLLDVNLNYVAYAREIEGWGVFGLSATVLSMGEQEITTIEEPEGTGDTYNVSSHAFQVSFARRLTSQFSFGLSFKYVGEQIHREKSSGFAFDFGTLLYTGFRSLRLGMSISNVGPEMKFDGPDLDVPFDSDPDFPQKDEYSSRLNVDSYDLPLVFRVGLAYDFEFNDKFLVTLAAEAKHPNDNVQQGSIGTELNWNNNYFLRAGYKINYDEEGLALGGGLKTKVTDNTDLILNYAWVDYGRLETVHRFSASIAF
jgi:long-subunit fatty acid transport protein